MAVDVRVKEHYLVAGFGRAQDVLPVRFSCSSKEQYFATEPGRQAARHPIVA